MGEWVGRVVLAGSGTNLGPQNGLGWHSHPHVAEVVYYTKGRGFFLLPEKEIPFSPGTLVLVPPGTRHNEKSAKPWSSCYVQYKTVEPTEAVWVREERGNQPMRRILELICDEFSRGERGWPAVCEGLLSSLEAKCQRPVLEVTREVENLRELLVKNLQTGDFHLKSIRDRFSLSHVTLGQRFRKATGRTPYQYLLELRVAEGARLLATTAAPVAQVAEACGFLDPLHFSKSFRLKTGRSPRAFRLAVSTLQSPSRRSAKGDGQKDL